MASMLDNAQELKKYDLSNVIGSIDALHQQVDHAWEATKSIHFEPSAEIKNVLVVGMGGSSLGAHIIKTVFSGQLTVPFDLMNNYTLPAYVNENTLLVLASYSGTTEEVVAAGEQAVERGAQVVVIAAGGTLAAMAAEHQWPIYTIEPTYNPSNQPRMALGYAVFGMVALLAQAGIISMTDQEKDGVVAAIKKVQAANTQSVSSENNQAKQLAESIMGKRPIYVISDHLEGALHAAANQANENAKIYADYKVVPEINHHLMEGLRFPASNTDTHLFIFVNSELYHSRNQARMKLTQQVVENNKISTTSVKLSAPTKIAQAFEALTLFAYVGFYVSMLEKIDPAPIPFVDWFKDELKKA